MNVAHIRATLAKAREAMEQPTRVMLDQLDHDPANWYLRAQLPSSALMYLALVEIVDALERNER